MGDVGGSPTIPEPQFLAGLNAEHAFTQANGFWFQLGAGAQSQAKIGWGPANPQALNRYAYVLNNPIRYTDPTGHGQVRNESDHPILVYGSKWVDSCDESDSRCKKVGYRYLLDRVVVELRPGENSKDKGMEDVDGIIERIDTDSKGNTKITGWRVYGEETAVVIGRDSIGQVQVVIEADPGIRTRSAAAALTNWLNHGDVRRELLSWDHLIWTEVSPPYPGPP